MKVLVLNCGSSSLKYKLFDMKEKKALAKGLAERIGSSGSRLKHYAVGRDEVVIDKPFHGHSEAMEAVFKVLTSPEHGVIGDVREIQAVGHRVLHGGEKFHRPVVVDDDVLKTLQECIELAPLHMRHNILGIKVCQKLISHATQVAVFDTEFHQTMPEYAFKYAIPHEIYELYKVRKYGFHGISHEYVAGMAAKMVGVKLENLKIITCHLGNGASLCAVKGGKCRDTTMGFTPLGGVIMGTRCGDVDPAIIPFMAEKTGFSLSQIVEMLNTKSGVLGISGFSSDFRDIEKAARAGHSGACLALSMFIYSVSKAIGSLIPVIGGLDVLVFTAGIGENSPEIRRGICAKLDFLGVVLDEQRNSAGGNEMEISTPASLVKVLVIPTDEEKAIAEKTVELLDNSLADKYVS